MTNITQATQRYPKQGSRNKQSDLFPLTESISHLLSGKLIFFYKLPFNNYLGPLGFLLRPVITWF